MNYEFDKKEAASKAEQEKKAAIEALDKKKQSLFLLLVSILAAAIAFIALIIMRNLRNTRRQKDVIEQQKILVEGKQREIIDSIHYAKRIQRSLLPTEKYIDKNLNRLKDNK